MAIDTVLLAVGPGDGDRAAALAAATVEVAGPAEAEVVLAHVFDESEYASVLDRLGTERTETTPDDVARRQATIREIGERFDDAGVAYTVRGAVGDRGDSIVTLATEAGADRVLVGGRDRSPTGKAVFGSTAQDVLLSAPCPVTFVRD